MQKDRDGGRPSVGFLLKYLPGQVRAGSRELHPGCPSFLLNEAVSNTGYAGTASDGTKADPPNPSLNVKDVA